MQLWLLVLLSSLATYRLTRLVTRDAFPLIAIPREWLQEKWDPFDDASWANWNKYTAEEQALLTQKLRENGIPRPSQLRRSIAYLATCAWCASVWIAGGLAAFLMIFFHITWPVAILTWLTSSAVTGLIAQREPTDA